MLTKLQKNEIMISMYRNQLTVPEEFEMNIRPEICYFGQVRERDYQKPFGILQEDRRRHFYIVGKTGMGKSTLLENMILQDINNGHGVCFLDRSNTKEPKPLTTD